MDGHCHDHRCGCRASRYPVLRALSRTLAELIEDAVFVARARGVALADPRMADMAAPVVVAFSRENDWRGEPGRPKRRKPSRPFEPDRPLTLASLVAVFVLVAAITITLLVEMAR